MSRRIVVVAAIVAAGVCGVVGLGTFAAGDRFPHPTHDGLFPDGCKTCHAGIAGGNRTTFYSATTEMCTACHTEAGVRQVEWAPPAPQPGRLMFDHASHVGGRGIDCLTCHREPGATGAMDVVPAQPERCFTCHRLPGQKGETGAAPRLHAPGYRLNHGIAAASGAAECSSCHSAGFCSDCHNPGTAPGFHPRNYLQRHAAEAWARDTECSSCHSTEVFCRSCHLGAGIAQREAGANAYHDAEPLWILNHGRAARQGLESCASCHQQTDCMECHSAKSGWGIKPHGSSEPEGGGNEAMCRRCHTNLPED
jgi:predicted CXXCH cytochrome family protein